MKKTNNNIFSVLFFTALLTTTSCNSPSGEIQHQSIEKEQINTTLDQFNEAAANADFNTYFNFYTDDAIFIGTDATENWDKKDFMIWAKPHFDKKKTWKFKSIGRHIFFNKNGDLAWFDELLNTQMKICRGSGVLIKQGNEWKVQQYVLSMTIPNSLSDTVIKLKAPVEDELISNYMPVRPK
jgi:ketosteroid isomerase-like protein